VWHRDELPGRFVLLSLARSQSSCGAIPPALGSQHRLTALALCTHEAQENLYALHKDPNKSLDLSESCYKGALQAGQERESTRARTECDLQKTVYVRLEDDSKQKTWIVKRWHEA
jgi:hypothetical protein